MVKIEALIHPFKMEEARAALEALDVREFTACEVFDHGEASGTSVYRGAAYRSAAARIKLEMLVSRDDVDSVIEAVMRAARTRERGDRDGRILVYQIADAINIHSGTHSF
jgi:nitrogen regulatory protein P-II 1